MLVRADASDPEQVSAMVEAVEEKFGSLDILIPNATPDQPQKPIEEYDADFYRRMYEFFVLSPYHLARAVLPGMKERKWGRIINITSEVFHCGVPEFSAYVLQRAGKSGGAGAWRTSWPPSASRSIRWPPDGFRPSVMRTIRRKPRMLIWRRSPLGRWGTPEDVGNAVAYFSSDEASFVTGQTLCVNGGRTPW